VQSSKPLSPAKFYKDVIAGTPVREYTAEYLGSNHPEHSEVSGPPFRVTTKLENGLVSKKEFDYEQFTYQYTPCTDIQFCAPPEQITTTRGNVTEVREFDWGQGQAGPLLRRTVREYLHNAQPTYKTVNIVNKVLNETVFDGPTGQQKARTEFEYDSTPIVGTTGAPQHDYTNYPSTFTVRGNATKVKKWRNTDGTLLTTTYTYDDLGNIRSIQDPGLHTTTFSYDDGWSSGTFCLPPSNSLAYVTEKANALSPPHRIQLTYYPCTGLLQARRDENDIQASRAGTTFTYDLLNRTRITDSSDGGRTENVYNDIPPASIATSTKIDADVTTVMTSIFDGLGRVVTKLLTDPACGPGGSSHVDTTYDLVGRAATVTNSYCTTSDPTYGVTTYMYDEIGRTKKVIPPDGTEFSNNVATAYDGNTTTVTDQAGRPRKTFTDALGRITRVDEPGNGVQP
jgi:YD repeat-containing protein